MRINKADLIGGVPILKVRDALRRDGQFFTLARFAMLLRITPEAAQTVVAELLEMHYIEPFNHGWRTTIAGNALAFAKAGPGVRREVAQRHLDEFLERVRAVNGSDHYMRTVEEVTLFGSLLDPAADPVGDVDVGVTLAPRGEYDEREERRRSHAAAAAGRHFNTVTDYLAWPEIEVLRYLKSRSRVLSLVYTDGIPDDAPRRVIYRRDRDPMA